MGSITLQIYGFPFYVTEEQIKKFLEKHTGKETISTIEIMKTKTKGPRSRLTVDVQFTTPEFAESLLNRPERLCYRSSFLKIQNKDQDIIFNLKTTALNFGCQVSDTRFYVIWKAPDVSVDFEPGFRKISFVFTLEKVEYKLELSYDSIWQVQLCINQYIQSTNTLLWDRNGEKKQFLLIQMLGAPRIYEKLLSSSSNESKNSSSILDNQWVRTIDDFTPSCSIGQSSAMCLELPHNCELPDFQKNFPYYKEVEGSFIVEKGSSYSQNLDLVPIVGPPPEYELPYDILFKINSMVQNGCLAGPTLDKSFYDLVDPRYKPIHHIECALEELYHLKDCCYEPVNWLNEQYLKYETSTNVPKSPTISLASGQLYVRRVQITPLKVYFMGPEVIVSNRVLRNFRKDIDNFIRVTFVDEDWERIRSTDLSTPVNNSDKKNYTKVYNRIQNTLRSGIVIGDKKFEFLAFSSSQLRENSAWMFASKGSLTAASIREWMGDFSEIRNVAKYGARLGQCFGSSTETLRVYRYEIETIPDVETESTNGIKYVFSDGIGKISAQFARKVALKCGLQGITPSAFQIRYGGYKGVVAICPTSKKKLYLRKSMCKFISKNIKLDVLTWSKFQPCFLNRQIITLLSTLGVQDRVFEKMQEEAVHQLDLILTDPITAYETLEVMSKENTRILGEMLLCGYKPDEEPFLSMMLQTFRTSKLMDLRTKTRILVAKGRSMMGCLDETSTLDYGYVFIQASCIGGEQNHEDSFIRNTSNKSFIVVGEVVVTKNPCLHPGDIRVLKAIDVPALHHMVDCVVFPQKGKRPHPNECSGSDLDGDIYFISWDHDLVPPRQVEPMDYAPAPNVVLDRDVMIEEVDEYFSNYMINDSLGVIANTHTVFADKKELKAESPECLELARLFSVAVDFPKTGVPAELPPHLHARAYPDFMEKKDRPMYESDKVIGRLFRKVKNMAPHEHYEKSFTREVAKKSYDVDMEVDGFENYVSDAFYYKREYDFKLGNLMDYYGIKTEGEILGGSIMKLSKTFNMRRDVDAINLAVKALRKEARSRFDKKNTNSKQQEDEVEDDICAKASAWYHVTYHPKYWGRYNEGTNRPHFLSFPWSVCDKLIHNKKNNEIRKQNRSLELLELDLEPHLLLKDIIID